MYYNKLLFVLFINNNTDERNNGLAINIKEYV